MLVVSNTSPLTNLLAIDRFQLLAQLYETIAVPDAVFKEITVNSAHVEVQKGLIAKEEFQSLSWVKIKQVANRELVKSLMLELDQGEAEAIALSVETKAKLLLIDERKGRDVAKQMGVSTVGLIGVLIEAKHKNIIPNVKPILKNLKVDAGFWISEELFGRVLRKVQEKNR